MKPKPASKKQNIVVQGPAKLIKQSSGFSQGTQPIARNGGPTSSLQKTQMVIGRSNSISSAPLNDSDSLCLSRLSLKSLSSSSSTATKKEPPKPSSSSGSSGSASSTGVGISPAKSNRRKIDSETVYPTSSASILKTPAKVALKKKGQSGLSVCLSSSKLSSNISPASSISEWSTESSSSTSVNQSPSGGSSKTKPQPARAVAATGDMKVHNRKPPSPVQSQKLPNASTKISSATGCAKNCDSVSPQAQNEQMEKVALNDSFNLLQPTLYEEEAANAISGSSYTIHLYNLLDSPRENVTSIDCSQVHYANEDFWFEMTAMIPKMCSIVEGQVIWSVFWKEHY
ncbi:hypothetical protein Acr_22g0005090 [Actinidia rufa]|uniref:Uncharacterized protein n=1 Tax=Actinidia rufa TaxID=165716 RepID=A0A7J0GK44_9ERIC|nr:hypothetical protein Acr_22g0005090 [Actinidia rufa]